MPHGWKSTTLNSESEALRVLVDLQGKSWTSRGHSQLNRLVPSIDRKPRHKLDRAEKLALERQSIDQFRSAAHFFSSPGEWGSQSDDFVALMVLRHYGVPTRLLDW